MKTEVEIASMGYYLGTCKGKQTKCKVEEGVFLSNGT